MNETYDINPTEAVLPPKRGKAALLIGIVSAVVLCAALIIGCAALGVFDTRSPFEKTVSALFSDAPVLLENIEDGGRVQVSAALGSDLVETVGRNPLLLQLTSTAGQDAWLLEGGLGAENAMLDVALLADRQGLQLRSQQLLGDDALSLTLDEALCEQLDASIFAPDSGSAYAMDKEAYTLLRDQLEMLLQTDGEAATDVPTAALQEQLRLAWEEISAKLMAELTVSQGKETMSLLDGEKRVLVLTVTFDEQLLVVLADEIAAHWTDNDALYDAVREAVRLSLAQSGSDTDELLSETMKQLDDAIKQMRDTVRELAKDDFLDVTVRYATSGGYFVALDADVTWSVPDTQNSESSSGSARLQWTFGAKPRKKPDFDLTFTARADGEQTALATMTYRRTERADRLELTLEEATESEPIAGFAIELARETDGRFALSLLPQGEEREFESITLRGCLSENSRRVFDLTLDGLEAVDHEGEQQTLISESSLRIRAERGSFDISRHDGATELLAVSEQQLDTLLAEIEQRFTAYADTLNTALDATVLQDSWQYAEEYRLPLDETFLDYAIDRKTGRLFVATSNSHTTEITAYDLHTSKTLGELSLPQPIAGMDADNGVLAVCFTKTYGEVMAHLYDAQTLQKTRTLDFTTHIHQHVQNYPGAVFIDGSRVIVTTATGHCDTYIYDLETDTQIQLQYTKHHAGVALDRENHVLAVIDRALSRVDMMLYDAVSGQYLAGFEKLSSYGSEIPYFDGRTFQAYEKHYHANGTKTVPAKQEAMQQRVYNDRLKTTEALVRQDENCTVTLEADE
ncbi:MAG: hypothetical protein IJY66_06075, partial [Clostridia bacterium]|nr:hypothetical protein [Clostridia bacterium]